MTKQPVQSTQGSIRGDVRGNVQRDAKIGVITGSRKGLGRAITEHFLKQGYFIVGCSRQPSDLRHDSYRHFAIDVADEAAVHEMFKYVREKHGRLSFCINNAAAASMNHFLLTPSEQARKIIETNLFGTFLVSQEACRAMLPGPGRIINLSSAAVAIDLEGEAMYVASKAAIESLTRVLAKELVNQNVLVNAIAPGPIETDLIRGVPKEKIAALLQQIGRKRMTTATDVIQQIESLIDGPLSNKTGMILRA